MATVVPKKGSSGKFAVDRLAAFLREIGLEFVDIIVKSDQEPAI